jgi:site-specific recombinase XerD
MKTFRRFCLERRYLSDPQVLMVKGPKLPEQHPRGLSQEEERKLLAAAKRLGERDRMLVELLLRTSTAAPPVAIPSPSRLLSGALRSWRAPPP